MRDQKFLILYLRYKRDLRNMSRFIEYIVYTIKQDFIERLSGIPQFSKFSICVKVFKFSKRAKVFKTCTLTVMSQ